MSKETIQMTSRPIRSTSRRLGALLSSLLVALTAGLALWPAGALAAADLEVALKGTRSEAQMVVVRAGSGDFRLRFGTGGPGVGQTGDIALAANGSQTATRVQAALNALSNVSAGGGSVTVLGAPDPGTDGQVFRVIFDGGALEGTGVPQLVAIEGTTPLATTSVTEFADRLDVDTIEQAGLRGNDRRIDYYATVRNAASTDPAVGDVLSCNPNAGGWFNTASFSYQWVRDGVSLGSANGAQTTSYTVQAADSGHVLQCMVKGSNAGSATLSFSETITPAPAPVPRAPSWSGPLSPRPTVTGSFAAPRTCNAPATWTVDHDGDPGTAAVAYSGPWEYQWLRNGEPIPGATTDTYTPQAGPGEPDEIKILQCRITGANASGAAVGLSISSATAPAGSFTTAPANNAGQQRPFLAFGNVTGGPVTLEVELPSGLDTRAVAIYNRYADSPIPIPGAPLSAPLVDGWSCVAHEATVSVAARVVCTRSDGLGPQQSYPPVGVGIVFGSDTPNSATVTATVSGGGDPTPGVDSDQFDRSADALPFGIAANGLATELIDRFWDDHTQAGGHPWAGYANVSFNSHRRAAVSALYDREGPNGYVKRLRTDLPAGLVGNALAPTERCDAAAKLTETTLACPAGSVVGEARYKSPGLGVLTVGAVPSRKPLVALEPERGVVAQFAFGDSVTKGVYVVDARLDPANNYSVVLETAPIVQWPEFNGLGATICSYGASMSPDNVNPRGCRQKDDPGAFEKPLLTAPTACEDNQVTKMTANSWENPGVFSSLSVAEPAMTGCDQVPFTPAVVMSPTSRMAGGASGLDASISVPSDGLEDPDGIAQAHLKKTVVELPAGVSVNPSAATGLRGCTDGQLGLGTDSEPGCPDGSKIAEVTATTPVLEETLSGVMVLRTPESTDPMSGGMFRMALIVRNDERGILVKLPGSATADPQSGRLVATFDDNPQLPIGDINVKVKGGDRGVLAMPQDCGDIQTKASLTPWSGGPDAVSDTSSSVDERCDNGFAPKLAAGNSDNKARGQGGTYSFRFSREDGEQWLRGLTAKLPNGLLASVRDVPLCSNGAADAGNCPAASKIGVADAKAGAGDPFVLEEKGEVFLTEGYKGGEYGLAVKVRPVAGPFRGEHELSPIVVRQAIHVDRTTAEVTAVSDPFPLIHHGVPLRVREVNVLVNRGGFMLNPSDCAAKQTGASLLSNEGATANLSAPFQVSDCDDLAFKPKLTLALSGKRQVTTGKHPGIKAKVTQQGISEAGIEKAVVRLPKSLALDVNNAQALCEFADGTKPDLENHCPKGSIVGRARATTPLLNDPLVGNVYFVKNVRKDPKTGNEIRTLPMIIVALRGEIAVNLKGESDTTKSGKLVSTFASVPDAPISQFNLNIQGGKNGILAVTRTRRALINLCAKPKSHIAESDMDGHNGRRHDTDIRMRTPCTRKQTKAAKRQAKRAAAKR